MQERPERHIDDLVDAYALGALEPDEVDVVERHLETCASCRALADAARRTLDLLLYAVPPVAPPPSLRARVLARTATEKAELLADNVPPHGGDHASGTALEPAQNPFGRLVQALRAGSSAGGDAGALLRDLLADPDCTIRLVPGTAEAPAANARLVVSPHRTAGVLVAGGLPRQGAGRAYQVWLLRGGQVLPNAVFEVSRSGMGAGIVRTPEPWDTFETVAVTPEPKGGSRTPTGPIVLAGSLAEQTS
jgi:anti-sigma-K factor RskA